MFVWDADIVSSARDMSTMGNNKTWYVHAIENVKRSTHSNGNHRARHRLLDRVPELVLVNINITPLHALAQDI